MKEPKATCSIAEGRLTITVDPGNCARDWFYMLADAVKDRVWALSGTAHEDAVYLEAISEAIAAAVKKADEGNQRNIANIFG